VSVFDIAAGAYSAQPVRPPLPLSEAVKLNSVAEFILATGGLAAVIKRSWDEEKK